MPWHGCCVYLAKLYQNDGDGTFVDVAAGVDDGRLGGHRPSWSDYDLDGDVDLYVPNHGAPNSFFENQADGSFIDVAAARGIDGGDGTSRFSFWPTTTTTAIRIFS